MAKQKPASTKPAKTSDDDLPHAIVMKGLPPRRDLRRWIYGILDVVAANIYLYVITTVIPNRLALASIHMWTIPILTLVMGGGMLRGNRLGRKIALVSGSLLILSVFLLIVRIVISAAFLSGVYGAFGKGAVVFAFVLVALVVEVVGLLPIVQVKYLMTRAGRRTYGAP